MEVAGRPLVSWSLDAFAEAEAIGPVIVAAPPGYEGEVAALAPGAAVVTGAESRSGSVAVALERVTTGLVAIHDAARPCVTPGLIDELVGQLLAHPGAAGVIAAAAITDTVKRASEPRSATGEPPDGLAIQSTENRDHLWAAQTPQVFRTDALRDALASDPRLVATASDDAMLVERAGGEILIDPAPAWNLKVTTPADLTIAAALLGARP